MLLNLAFIASIASFIISSDSLEYTNPLVTISGPAIILPVSLLVVKTITTTPSCDNCCLSFKTIFPISPTPNPSTSVEPAFTFPLIFTADFVTSTLLPF